MVQATVSSSWNLIRLARWMLVTLMLILGGDGVVDCTDAFPIITRKTCRQQQSPTTLSSPLEWSPTRGGDGRDSGFREGSSNIVSARWRNILQRTRLLRGGGRGGGSKGRLNFPERWSSSSTLTAAGSSSSTFLKMYGAAVTVEGASSDDDGMYDEYYQPPVIEKTKEERSFIMETLSANFMFQDLPDDVLEQLVLAFEIIEKQSGEIIVKQGDTNADYMYIVANGECKVQMDNKVLPEPFGTMMKRSMIGELALLYDAPRAATVTAKDGFTVKLFRLDRSSFLYFLKTKSDITPDDIKNELKLIDPAIDKISGVKTRYEGGTIIRQYDPNTLWLWKQWKGTILSHAWKGTIMNMALSLALVMYVRFYISPTWAITSTPDITTNPFLGRLSMFSKVWKYVMSLTTFILTFFLSQAYGLWREMYSSARKIQGRLHDVGMLCAASAKRNPKHGHYEKDSNKVLDEIASMQRLMGAFCWAKFSKPFQVLVTPRGLSRMLSRGLLTRTQYQALSILDPGVGIHNAVVGWLTTYVVRSFHDGHLLQSEATEHVLLSKLCELRGTAAGISDILDGRMPLAYVHFVQVLVDTFLIAAPFALYVECGIWSILAVGLLTLFYSGLLDLAKILLDPLDNDEFYKDSVNMDIGVLIREMNNGSTRFKKASENLPFKVQAISEKLLGTTI